MLGNILRFYFVFGKIFALLWQSFLNFLAHLISCLAKNCFRIRSWEECVKIFQGVFFLIFTSNRQFSKGYVSMRGSLVDRVLDWRVQGPWFDSRPEFFYKGKDQEQQLE